MIYTCPVCFVTKNSEEDDDIESGNNFIFINLSCNHHICETCYVEWHIKKRDPKCVVCRQKVIVFTNLESQKSSLTIYSLYKRICIFFLFIILILLLIIFFKQKKDLYIILTIVCSCGIFFSIIAIDNYMLRICLSTNE